MNTPGNVPPITDVRFASWDRLEITHRQVAKLAVLLRESGVDAAEMFGEGFTSVGDLSRWAASWGIGYLIAAEDAYFIEEGRKRIEREAQENREAALKSMIADHFRRQARG